MTTPRGGNEEMMFNQECEEVRIGSAGIGMRVGINLITRIDKGNEKRRNTTAGYGSKLRVTSS